MPGYGGVGVEYISVYIQIITEISSQFEGKIVFENTFEMITDKLCPGGYISFQTGMGATNIMRLCTVKPENVSI